MILYNSKIIDEFLNSGQGGNGIAMCISFCT